MLDSARREVPVPALARWLLGLGIAATLAANVAHGLGHGPVGAGAVPRGWAGAGDPRGAGGMADLAAGRPAARRCDRASWRVDRARGDALFTTV
jgi:hypothetical protein